MTVYSMRGLHARDHVAGVQPDPQAERRAAAALVVEHPAHRPLHRQRGPDRPLGVVLVRDRGAEDRHDPVAGELVDVPAEGLHRAGERGEHPVGDRADPLRVEVLRPGGEVGQVAEEHGDDPALGGGQRGGGRQRGAAVVAEPRAGHGDRSADRAGHRATHQPGIWAFGCATTLVILRPETVGHDADCGILHVKIALMYLWHTPGILGQRRPKTRIFAGHGLALPSGPAESSRFR